MAAVAALATLAGFATALTFASPASADTPTQPSGVSPVIQRPANNVTADVLPTVQIDGVVWAEKVVGNTVYAGGSFANARPAGAAAGTNLTPRGNLLAFDITTGNLITSFAPSLNAQVKAVTASPDGTRLYVGGAFTTADGVARYRIAAYDTASGALVTTFAPSVDATVLAIAATNTTVYVAGNFGNASGQTRSHFAAFNASNGALLPWAPTSDVPSSGVGVQAMILSPDNTKLIAGGGFTVINGSPAYGLGAIDATTGALLPYAANNTVRDAGANSAILSLSTDGTQVYSTGYTYGGSGNFEGVMSSNPVTGAINWLADCHGDSYGASSSGNGVVYTVSHFHDCQNMGGFPDTNPRNVWHRSTAYTTTVTGSDLKDIAQNAGYGNFQGQPTPSLIDWMPDLAVGTFTGTGQAAWSVAATNNYVVEGGEFPSVNGTAQQGLVRFAVPSLATNKQGPMLYGAAITPTVTARSSTSIRLTWPSNWDRDDQTLTYVVRRSDKGTTPVYTVNADSQSWNLQGLSWIDTGLTPNTTYTYTVRAVDQNGNYQGSPAVSATTPATSTPDSAYVSDVIGAGATNYWRLDQASGSTTAVDYVGAKNLTLGAGVTAGAAGAIAGDPDTASTFSGTSTGFGATSGQVYGPNTFTESAWFSTTSTTGGKIVGFGDKNTGTSASDDRHLYMDTTGHVYFGVYNVTAFTVRSPASYNDGKYHQIVGTLSSAGLALYVDGQLIGTNAGTTIGQPYWGYWRVGGDVNWSGASSFKGAIDDVAIYPTALTLAQIRQQYIDSGRGGAGLTAPSDTYGATVWNDGPSFYYRLDELSGPTATDASGHQNNGVIAGGVTLGAASPVSGATGTAAAFNGATGSTVGSGVSGAPPTVYSEEAWINTTSTAGGKIIGFGNSQTGSSSSYDRNVYMLANGKIVFGTKPSALNLATSTNAYNDGKWHYVVATQSSAGMKLYVDDQLVATNAATTASTANGYWRVGGDNLANWGANGFYFNGKIDEVAVYPTALTPAQVQAHYRASGADVNAAPTASFTATPNGATVAVDATASTDPDGTVASYAWDFGDGTQGTGVTAAHTYAASNSYVITLTVTDDQGATATTTQTVVVTKPNVPPVAAFTATPTKLSVAFDASASADSDGSIVSYSWDFGDSTSGTGVSPTHVYGAAGTFNAVLTVTDNSGATTSLTKAVTVVANVAPVAAFTATPTKLSVAFNASGSTDSDGSIASYSWDFGDSTSGTGVSPTHVYGAAGTFNAVLTVTDNNGATTSLTKAVTVVANVAPVASFTATPTALSVAFNPRHPPIPTGRSCPIRGTSVIRRRALASHRRTSTVRPGRSTRC